MINNCSKGNNKSNSYKDNDNDDNIIKIYEKSVKILNEINNSNILQFDELFSINKDNNKSFISQNTFFLINKVWFEKFKSFCKSKNPFGEFLYPGKIDNDILIIQDNSALKTSTDTRIFFNNVNDFDKSCCFIEKRLWRKIFEICGGGPEYEIKPYQDKHTNLIIEGGHINLLFIPRKINNINDIKRNHFYFNLNRKIKDLREYINKLINSKKEKFSIKRNNYQLEENKDYRLWLYSTFYDPNKNKENNKNETFENYLYKLFCEYKNENNIFNNEKNKKEIIDWQKFQIDEHDFKINLLSFFDNNQIKDVFPNIYTKFFDRKKYEKYTYKDVYHLPEFTIIIEQAPFRFITPELKYSIGKCSRCDYSEIVYCACQCKKLFFCSNNCQTKYAGNHLSECKISLINNFKKQNKQFSEKKYLIKYSLKGLTNLGNTCYMNSALQCMRSIKELTLYFLNYFDESQLNVNNIIGTGGFLTLAYINLLYNMNDTQDGKGDFIPKEFKTTIGLIDDRFSDNNQQDTHEFMTFLIDSLHEDLNKVINKPKIKRKDSEYNNYDSNKISDDKKSLIEWNNFLKLNQSIMVDLFYGQYKTTILCPHCEHKSINFSIYLNLQLPIPKYKENYIVKFDFQEECPTPIPVKFSIIINKQNNKISDVKKIIGNIFGVSPYEIEIVQYQAKKKMIKIFEDKDEIDEKIGLAAIKMISRKMEENILYDPNIIDYSNLKQNIENKKDELIQIFKNNIDINDENNNDLDITIDINDNNNLSNDNNFDKYIIKHKMITNDSIYKDCLIYLENNKSYYDIYYKIFGIYYEIIIEQYLYSNKINLGNYNDEEHKKNMFDMFFKDFADKETQFSNNVFEKYKSLPFILKFGDLHNSFIPPLKNHFFKDLLNDNKMKNQNVIEKEDKNDNFNNINNTNEIYLKEKYKEDHIQEEHIQDDLNISGINNNSVNNDDQFSNIDINIPGNNGINKEYDPTLPQMNFNLNEQQNYLEDTKEKEISIQITRDNDNENKENNIEEINNKFKNIIIIWNTKFLLKKEINNEYKLIETKVSETIDLCNFFQKMFEEHFQNIYIEDCFEEFCKEETFDKDNLWKCSKCQENIEAKNKIEIYQIPKILIIQLKRFKNNQKIESFIDFPIKDLDVSKFITSTTTIENAPSKKYDLFAVVNHYGRLEYGHYDAFCLNYDDNCWYHFNDRIVKKINKEDEINKIVTKEAYVLFYRQQNIDLIDWDKIYKKNFVDINEYNMKSFDEDFIYRKVINNIKKGKDSCELNLDKLLTQSTNITENTIRQIEIEEFNEETNSLDDLSLNSFVYNPFNKNYLRLKRHRQKNKNKK